MMLLIAVLQISGVSCTTDTHLYYAIKIDIIFQKVWEGIAGF